MFDFNAYVDACEARECTYKTSEFSTGTFVSQVFTSAFALRCVIILPAVERPQHQEFCPVWTFLYCLDAHYQVLTCRPDVQQVGALFSFVQMVVFLLFGSVFRVVFQKWFLLASNLKA